MKILSRLLLLLVLSAPVFSFAQEPLQREVYLMGTTFKVTTFEKDQTRALQEMEALVKIVEQTEEQLSTWRDDSEISKINRKKVGEKTQLSPTLCLLMQRIRKWTIDTGGTFDPTVGRLLSIWGIQSSAQFPDDASIRKAVSLTGFQHLHQDACSVEKQADVLLDTGAFGKGEALDRAADWMRKEKFAPAVLDFGGQILVWQMNRPIVVSLADPAAREKESVVKVTLSAGSLSTSGGSERDQIVNGKRVGHIVDPRTGYPVPSFGSVTVWNEKALDADVLSTALYVMGPDKGFQWAVQHHIAACFLLRNQKRPVTTPEFKSFILK